MQDVGGNPRRLERRIEDISERLRVLAIENYHVFVQSQQCSQVVASELKSLEENLLIVEKDLPQLQQTCNDIHTSVQDAAMKNAEIQYVLKHYDELMELLEIPQLIEGCIANDLLEEALESIQFTKKLFEQSYSKKNTPRNAILQTLLHEVQNASQILREKIVLKLRDDLPLAKCLHMVTYLRRIDGLWDLLPVDYDQKLKLEFLNCRNTWLTKTIQSIPTSDPYNYIMQVIDAKRTTWFDMITQYSAIFGHQEVNGHIDKPLCSWAIETVSELVHIVNDVLPNLSDFGAIANVMEQILFFGGSLGRVGVDFRGIILVQFQTYLFEKISVQWNEIVDEFELNLAAHGSKQSTTPIMIASFRNMALPTDDLSPPHSLMAFPVLAQLTNGYLNSFNDLRLCALLSLHYRLSHALQTSMIRIVNVIASFCTENNLNLLMIPTETAQSSGKAPLHVQMQKLVQVLQTDSIPYIQGCFQKLFTQGLDLPTALNQNELLHIMQENCILTDPSMNQ